MSKLKPSISSKNKLTSKEITVKKSNIVKENNFKISSYDYFSIVSFAIVVTLFLVFGTWHLGKFIWTDGPPMWYFTGIPEFWENLRTGNWQKLSPSLNNYSAIETHFLAGLVTQNFISIHDYSPENFDKYMFWMRFPTIIFNSILLIILYHFAKKIWNKQVAMIILVLSALNPLTIGISQFVLGDSTSWSTLILSFLSYFLYLKEPKTKYVITTGIFFALTVFSKFQGLIVYPISFFILIFEYLFKKLNTEEIAKRFKGLLLIYIVFFIVSYIIFPPAWKNPIRLYYATFGHYSISSLKIAMPMLIVLFAIEIFLLKGKLLNKISEKFDLEKFMLISSASFLIIAFILVFLHKLGLYELDLDFGVYGGTTTGNLLTAFYTPFSSLSNILTSIMFYAIVIAFILIFTKHGKTFNKKYAFYALFIFIIFSLGSAIGGYKTWWKYQIIFIPVFAVFIAVVYEKFIKQYYKISVIALIIINSGEILNAHPNYFHFRNQFYPFAKLEVKYEGNTGGYELAQKLNKVSGADTLKVLSDTYGFMYYFKGKNKVISEQLNRKKIQEYDYLFLSSFGGNEKRNWNLLPYYIMKYYEQDLDSAFAYMGNKKYFTKLVKVKKNDKVFVPDSCFNTGFFVDFNRKNTISFWFKTTNMNAGNIIQIGKNEEDLLSFSLDSLHLSIKYNNKILFKSNSIIENKWQNVEWISENNLEELTNKIYLNNKFIGKFKLSNNSKPYKAVFLNNNFKGNVDDVRIYHKALNEAQIKKIYNNGEIERKRVLEVDGKKFYPKRHFTKHQ